MKYDYGSECEYCGKEFAPKAGKTAKDGHYRSCKSAQAKDASFIMYEKCPHCDQQSLEENDRFCKACGGEIWWD